MLRPSWLTRGVLLSVLASASIGCGGDDDAPGDADDAGDDALDGPLEPRLAFSPPGEGDTASLDLLPFPNDLVVAQGGVQLAAESFQLPAGNRAFLSNLAEAFGERGCYGPAGGVVFPVEGDGDLEIDSGSLAGAIRYVDLATGAELPTETFARDGAHQIYVRPARGTVLAPGATYGVVVTTAAQLTGGIDLRGAANLDAVLRGDDEAPELAAAVAAYAPLRAWLDSAEDAPAVDDIAGATVFTTCDYAADLEAVAAQLDARPAPAFTLTRLYRAGAELDGFLGTPGDNAFPGLDNPGGIAHASIGFVAIGTFPSPNYQSDTPGGLGRWELGEDGEPVAKGEDPVPVILVLPAGVESYADLPVVVFTHGLGGTMDAVLAVANTLAARGFAVMGIDIPFHGGRLPGAADNDHNFGGGEGPDGLADGNPAGSLFAFFDINGGPDAAPLDPRVQADGFRQAAVDLMGLARLIDGGDLSAIRDAEPALAELGLRGDRITYSSESFGGFVGMLALAFEPRYQAGFLSVAGGGLLTDLLENSPTYGPPFLLLLGGAFGVSSSELDGTSGPPHTSRTLQLVSLLLGPGDPLTYAGRLPAKGVHLVLPAAHLDEAVPNPASEALAAAIGLSYAPLPGAVEGPSHVADGVLPEAELPLSGNLVVGDRALTAGFFEMETASHGMLTRRRGERRYMPDFPPFVPREEDEAFDNPIVELQAYLAEFAETYVATGTPTLGAAN